MTNRIPLAFLTLLAWLAATWLAAPVLAQDTEYLFGLSDKEILEVMDRYAGAGEYDETQVLEEMRAPFDCRRAGDLCSDLGTEGAYSLLSSLWSMALEGLDLERISAVGERLLGNLSDRYFEVTYPGGIDPLDPFLGLPGGEKECTERVVFVEDGRGFGLQQKSGRVPAVFVAGGYNNVTFFELNGNGDWVRRRTDSLTEEGTVFLTGPLGPEAFPRVKTETNSRHVGVRFYSGSIVPFTFTDPHAEGCGSSTGLSSLSACSCTGPRPAIYDGL